MSFETLKSELAGGILRRLYLFHGPEDYLVRHYAAEVERLAVGGGSGADAAMRAFCVTVFEGKTPAGDICNACATYPMVGERSLVIVKNAGIAKPSAKTAARAKPATGAKLGAGAKSAASARLGAGAKPASSAKPGASASMATATAASSKAGAVSDDAVLAGLFEAVPAHATLLVIEEEADKRTRAYGLMKEHGLAVEFLRQKPPELAKWASMACTRLGARLEGPALRRFIDRSSDSMTQLRGELEKLALYVARPGATQERRSMPAVTEQDVDAVCSFPARARIFDLMDRVAERDAGRALSTLSSLRAAGEPAARLMATLTRHIALLRQAKTMRGLGAKPADVAAGLKLNPYRAGLLFRQCANFSREALESAIMEALALDSRVKSGGIDDGLALELLVASLSRPRKGGG